MSDLIKISESDDWIVDYDKERGMYRTSYFQNNHFVDEHWFDAYENEELPVDLMNEFDCPINELRTAATLLCLALNINENGCKNCPVVLFDYDKRTKYEKCCLHEPCQTNLYKWLKEKSDA